MTNAEKEKAVAEYRKYNQEQRDEQGRTIRAPRHSVKQKEN